jgi:hypothetical protein
MTENCKFHYPHFTTFRNETWQWNIANFVMLFQAVIKILSRLVEFKILINMGLVHYPQLRVFDRVFIIRNFVASL